jgi:hypothetical protein
MLAERLQGGTRGGAFLSLFWRYSLREDIGRLKGEVCNLSLSMVAQFYQRCRHFQTWPFMLARMVDDSCPDQRGVARDFWNAPGCDLDVGMSHKVKQLFGDADSLFEDKEFRAMLFELERRVPSHQHAHRTALGVDLAEQWRPVSETTARNRGRDRFVGAMEA